jgi:hypothetical protein
MNRLERLALLATIVVAPPSAAQTAPSSNFAPLEFAVGHCWIGTFPNGKQTDEHCFEWMYDRKFIRDRHVVRAAESPGPALYEGETIYAWDAKTKRIGFTYYNVAGDVMNGLVDAGPEGIVFPQTYETAGRVRELKSTWTRSSADAYRVVVTEKSGETWKELWTMELKREP